MLPPLSYKQFLLFVTSLLISVVSVGQFPGVPVPVGVPGVGVGVPDVTQQLYDYPNPYANKAVSYQSTYLFKNAEISSDGSGKIIYGLAFEVLDPQASLLRNYTISIAEVPWDEIPVGPIAATFDEVYSRAGYVEHTGINTHIFDQPYCLESNKNVLVKICVKNYTDERSHNAGIVSVTPDSTKFSSYHDWSFDVVDLCNGTQTANAKRYKKRPLTYFYLNPISTIDVEALKVDKPGSIELINTSHTPTFSFRNYSCDSLKNYSVNYKVNNEPVVTEYPNIMLGSNDTVHHTFATPIALDKEGFQVLKFWTSSPDDQNAVNDTVQRLVWVRKTEFEGLDYSGTDFWLGFMENFTNNNSLVQEIFITSVDATNVTVEMPYLGWVKTLSLNPFEVKKIQVPVEYGGYVVANNKPGVKQPVGIHVQSEKEVSVYGLSNSYQSSDGFLAIPTPSLGRLYYTISPIGTYFPASIPGTVVDETPAQILLIGTEDNTQASVVLSNPANGKNKGDTISITLNAGETYLIEAKTDRFLNVPTGGYDLSGSKIISNNKIGIIGGAQCALVPGIDQIDACQYCDHIMEQMTPATTWGNVYYFTDYEFKPGVDILRVVSSNPGTTAVNIGGVVYTLTGEGDYVDHKFEGGIKVTASNPVQVVQMCTGGRCLPVSGTDPFYINGVPIAQWGKIYSFSTVVSQAFPFHYVNILKRSNNSRVAIDGALLDASLFEQIPNSDIYSCKLKVKAGAHLITSDTNIFVNVYGFGRDDAYGYPASGSKLKPIQVEEPTLTSVTIDVKCANDSTGEIFVEGLLGTPPYQFIWDDGFVGDHRTNVPAGKYVVTLIDDYGYTAKDTIEVLEREKIELEAFKKDVTCFGFMDGEATYTTNRDTLKSAIWSTGSTEKKINYLDTGMYIITLVDTAFCTISDTVIIEEPQPLKLTLNPTIPSCFKGKDAKLYFSQKGGVAPFTFRFKEGLTPADTNYFGEGDYNVSITDANNCYLDTNFSIVNPPKIWANVTVQQAGCEGLNEGKIEINEVFNGQSQYKYFLNNKQRLIPRWDSLSSGDYSIQVADQKGCVLDTTITLINYQYPEFTWQISGDSCSKGVGAIDLLPVSSGQYFVKWVDLPDTTFNLSRTNLIGDNVYKVSIGNEFCFSNYEIEIPISAGVDFSTEVIPAHCGLNNGEIFFTKTLGDGIITTQPFYASNADTLKNVRPGIITARLASETCFVEKSVIVPDVPVLSLDSISIKPSACGASNGEAVAFLGEHSGVVRYQWSRGDLNARLKNADSGFYAVHINDDYCTIDSTIYIPNIAPPEVDITITKSLCGNANGQIQISPQEPSNELSIAWEHNASLNSFTADSLLAGEYKFTVSNAFCGTTHTVYLTDTVSFLLNTTQSPEHCSLQDGSIELVVQGNANHFIKWDYSDTAQYNLNKLSAGKYKVIVNDNFCTDSLELDISNIAGPTISLSSSPETCKQNNGEIFVSASSQTGMLYYYVNNTLHGSNSSIKNLRAGKYEVSVSDGYCFASDSIMVDSILPIDYTTVIQNETCSNTNATVEVNVEPGVNYTIAWEMGSTSNQPPINMAGTYPFTISDDYCTQFDTVQISNLLGPQITVDTIISATCDKNNGEIYIVVTGPESPYSINWNEQSANNSLGITNLIDSTYRVVVSGAVCSDSLLITVPRKPALMVNSVLIKKADCESPSGKVSFSFSNNQGPVILSSNGNTYTNPSEIANLPVGFFVFEATDGVCTFKDSVYVAEGLNLMHNKSVVNETCKQANGSIQLTYNSQSSVVTSLWNDGGVGFTRNGLSEGWYYYTISDSLCTVSDSAQILNHKAPSASLVVVNGETCNGNDGELTLTNILNTQTYTWSNGVNNAPSITGLATGMYSVTLQNQYCTIVLDTLVPLIPSPILAFNAQNSFCELSNGKVVLTPTVHSSALPYNIYEKPIDTLVSESISNLAVGKYTFVLQDKYLCTDTVQLSIEEKYLTPPEVKLFTNPSPLILGSVGEVFTNDISPWFISQWIINGDSTTAPRPRFIVNSSDLDISVVIQHTFGCTNTAYFNNIEVDDEVFYVPNTFTPDGDGYNEVYGPVLAGMEYWEGLIFNRWGEHIYTINQNNPTWDGKYKGELVQTGVYVVKYVYKPLNGFKKELFTHVNLLR